MSDPIRTRIQSRESLTKGLKEFEALRRSGTLKRSFTINVLSDGSVHLLVMGMKMDDVPPLLMIAVEASVGVLERDDTFQLDLKTNFPLDPQESTGRRREPEVKRLPDGTLEAPAGEHFISCAECGNARWLCTVTEDGGPGRDVCSRCGNEVKAVQIMHQEGRA